MSPHTHISSSHGALSNAEAIYFSL